MGLGLDGPPWGLPSTPDTGSWPLQDGATSRTSNMSLGEEEIEQKEQLKKGQVDGTYFG